jgi:hypothetical protein
MDTTIILEYQWPYFASFLASPEVIEETARDLGALQRKRRVDSASTLLRLAFAYGFCGLSLRQTAAWAEASGVASLSDVALLKRLRTASDWLGHLLVLKLAERTSPPLSPGGRLRIVDATSVSRPASAGTDWRVHLGLQLASLTIDHIELTDVKGGESFRRFSFQSGDVVLADRGYAQRRGLARVLQAGADFVIRLPWSNIPLRHPNGDPFDLFRFLRGLPEAQAGHCEVEIKPDPRHHLPAFATRVVALRKSESAAEHTRQQLTRKAAQRGSLPDPRSLEAAAYVILLTSLDAESLPPAQVLDLYRFRWQIEIVFKRLKGLLELGELPARDPSLARTILFSKLLAALLLDDFTGAFLSLSPWGFHLH